jgi:serine protease
MRVTATLIAIAVLFTACLNPRFPPGITGTVFAPIRFSAAPGYEHARFKPGEAIVRFKNSGAARAQSANTVSSTITTNTVVLQRPQIAGARAQSVNDARRQTLEWISELRARGDVVFAEPNTILHLASVPTPNDSRYAAQWNYPALKLPEAWSSFSDESAVGAGVTVAVVDSGILWDNADAAKRHPDFNCEVAPGIAKIAPGYDFAFNDSNPFDDTLSAGAALSGYHGSHVAGTAAACSNDGFGVAGVAWKSRILPVRVFDGDSGSIADVAKGMLWAVGAPVTGAPSNPNPAQVLNLSLGAQQAPSSVLQDAVNEANARGAVVVVASGNDGVDASSLTPANLQGVIVVGALGAANEVAPYSDYGALVSVVAPGGNFARRGLATDGVLSVQACGAGGADLGDYGSPVGGTVLPCAGTQVPGSGYLQGTSMSTPHIAGLIALMMSRQTELLNPSTTLEKTRNWVRVLSYLRSASSITGVTGCERGCGAGLVNAATAVNLAASLPGIGSQIVLTAPIGDFNLGTTDSALSFTLKNVGDTSATLNLNSADSRLSFTPTTATVAPNASQTFALKLNRAGLSGDYATNVMATYGTQQFQMRVYYQNGRNTLADSSGYFVRLYSVAGADRQRINYPDTPLEGNGTFRLMNLEPGTYDLTAYHLMSTNPDGTVVTDQLGERLGVNVEDFVREQDITLLPVTQTICSRDGNIKDGPKKCPGQ